MTLRLGINIDHVATVRNARGGSHPCPVRAALLAAQAGADGITAHLREDRRHIRDEDIARLKAEVALPLNLEMAATKEMLAIACRAKPHAACIVPEKRTEVTTEGGLDAAHHQSMLSEYTAALTASGIRVSLFIDPSPRQVEAAKDIGAPVVEFHTGKYCELTGAAQARELKLIQEACVLATNLGIECHAGHGLNYENVGAIAAIAQIHELNIGHFLIGEAIYTGMAEAIREMRRRMDLARESI